MEINKTALVTGANGGIGFAVAKELLKQDITVIITSRSEKEGKQVTKKWLASHFR